MWTFWNWGDISHSPASWKATQTKNPSNYHTKTRGQNISCRLQNKKRENIPNGSVPPQEFRPNQSRLTCDQNWKVVKPTNSYWNRLLADVPHLQGLLPENGRQSVPHVSKVKGRQGNFDNYFNFIYLKIIQQLKPILQ